MDAAVAGTIARFRPTRSYTNPRDVTSGGSYGPTVSSWVVNSLRTAG